jgi:hypothetical protein
MTSEAMLLALNDAAPGSLQSIDFEGTVNGVLCTQRITTFAVPRTPSRAEIDEFTNRIFAPLAGGKKTAIAMGPADVQHLLFSHKASRCCMWETARHCRTALVNEVSDRDRVVFRVIYAPPEALSWVHQLARCCTQRTPGSWAHGGLFDSHQLGPQDTGRSPRLGKVTDDFARDIVRSESTLKRRS